MNKIVWLILLGGLVYFFSVKRPTADAHTSAIGSDSGFSATDSKGTEKSPEKHYDSIFNIHTEFITDGFDFPVGKPDAQNYFNAQTFGENFHLGEDWNGKGGGNTDLGDPVFSVANGLVVFTEDVCCGWGNTVRIIHKLPDHSEFKYIESLYTHLHYISVKNGAFVKRGEQIGAIGTAHGRYLAHLHFEMRDFIDMPIGSGYSQDNNGYIAPTNFINKNRPSGK